MSSLLYYTGTAGSIAAPGGNTYQVCGTPGDDVWHCTPMLWVGNPVPLFEDTFNDGNFLAPDWEELSAATCPGCWSAAGLKAAVDIPFSSVNTQAWIAAGDPAWGDYTVMAELRYSNGPDEDMVVRHGSNGSYYNINMHHHTDSLDIRLFAVDATGAQHNLVCCPGSLVADLAPDVTYQIQVDVRGTGLRIYFGRLGQPLSLYLDHADTSGHVTANGRIGLRGWTGTHAQEHATFDNVRVFR